MFFRRPDISKLREQGDEAGLLNALEHKDPAVREAAAGALEGLAGPEAVVPLTVVLEDSSRSVRLAAVSTLGQIRAVEPLILALNDADSRVQGAAAKALAVVGDARAIDPLIGLLEDQDPHVRGAGVRALAAFDDQRVVGPLAVTLEDESNSLRHAALSALEGRDDVDGQLLSGLLMRESVGIHARKWAAGRLVKDGRANAVDALIRALEHGESDEVRSTAREALGEVDDQRAQEALERERRGLAERDARESVEEDQGWAEALEGDENEIARIIAAERLAEKAKAGDADAVAPLIRALESDESGSVRKVALGGLREVDDPRVVDAVQHDPAVGDRFEYEWIHPHPLDENADTSDTWKGPLIEVWRSDEGRWEGRVRIEEASFADLVGSVRTVPLELPADFEKWGDTCIRVDPGSRGPYYSYCYSSSARERF